MSDKLDFEWLCLEQGIRDEMSPFYVQGTWHEITRDYLNRVYDQAHNECVEFGAFYTAADAAPVVEREVA